MLLQPVAILLTPVPINVGLMYRSSDFEWGIQLWSISNSRLMHSRSSDWSKAWRREGGGERERWGEWRMSGRTFHSSITSILPADKLSWQSWTCGSCWASVWRDAVGCHPRGTPWTLQTAGEERKDIFCNHSVYQYLIFQLHGQFYISNCIYMEFFQGNSSKNQQLFINSATLGN